MLRFDQRAQRSAHTLPKRVAVLLLITLAAAIQSQALAPDGASSLSPIQMALAGAPLRASLRSTLEGELQNRQYARAENIILEEIDKNPRSPRLLTLLGDVFFLDGKYLDCAVAMKKADAISAIDHQSRFTLAMAYIAINRTDWAQPVLEKLARDDPHNALYPYWISRVEYHEMHLSKAVVSVLKAIELAPRFMKAYNNLGVYYEGLGKYQEAANAYREAIRLNRQEGLRSPWPALNLGALLNKLGQLHIAESYLNEALTEDPRFPKAHFQLGILLEKEDKDAEAVQELDLAVAFDPMYAEPYFALGKIFARQHQPHKAREAFRMFQKLKKNEQLRDLGMSSMPPRRKF